MKEKQEGDSDYSELLNPKQFQQQQTFRVQSSLFPKYTQNIKIKTVDTPKAIRLFQKRGITYNPQKKFRHFNYQLITSNKRTETLIIKSFLGFFEIELHILVQLNNANPFQSIKQHQKGSYGQIYFFRLYDDELAFKCIFRNQFSSLQSTFSKVIRELSIFKIASALECTVHMERYLGYDLILYKDCFLFGMEKGTLVTHIAADLFEDLTQVLMTLHSFQIIHFDIKPENIVYSQHYKKLVLIDFGFSEIVKETIGFKTLTTFRGTPKFCGEEMLSILMNQKKSQYIDAYYNDLVCLRESFQALSLKSGNPASSQCIQFQQENIANLIHIQLQMYAFQYFYTSPHAMKAITILEYKNKQLIKQKGRQILSFLDKIVSLFFHDQIITELRQLEYLDEYQSIQRNLQLKNEKLSQSYLQNVDFSVSCPDNESKIHPFDLLLVNICEAEFTIEDSFSYNAINNTIRDLPAFKSGNLLRRDYQLLFYFVRFDVKNVSCIDKLTIASQFRQLVGEAIDVHVSPPYADIKFFFKYFLNKVILTSPQHGKHQFFDVIYQLILFGVPVEEEINQFVNIAKNQGDLIEKAITYFSFEKILELIYSINLNEGIKDYYAQLHRFLLAVQKSQLQMLTAWTCTNQEEETILSILRLLKKCYHEKEKAALFKQLSRLKNKIKDKRLHALTQKTIFKMIFKYKVDNLEIKQIILFVKYMLKHLSDLELHTAMIITKRYSVLLQVSNELLQFNKTIKSIFDCDEIYKRLDLDKFGYMLMPNYGSLEASMAYLEQINGCYKQYIELQQPVNSEIRILLQKIQIKKIAPAHLATLTSLFAKVQQQIFKIDGDAMIERHYYRQVFDDIVLLKMFAMMGFKSRYLEKQAVQVQVKELLPRLKFNRGESQLQMRCIMGNFFKSTLYLLEYFRDELDDSQIVLLVFRFSTIAKELHIYDIWFYSLHQIIQIASNFIRAQQQSTRIWCMDYIFDVLTKNQNFVYFFFMQVQWKDLFTFLNYFSRLNLANDLYRLLMMSINWIGQYPFDPYIQSFALNIDEFCRKSPQCIMFHPLNKFIPMVNMQTNPYIALIYINTAYLEIIEVKQMLLKFFTSYLERLSRLTKNIILNKYYYIALSLPNFAERKINSILYKQAKNHLDKGRYRILIKDAQREINRSVKDRKIMLHRLMHHKHKYLSSI